MACFYRGVKRLFDVFVICAGTGYERREAWASSSHHHDDKLTQKSVRLLVLLGQQFLPFIFVIDAVLVARFDTSRAKKLWCPTRSFVHLGGDPDQSQQLTRLCCHTCSLAAMKEAEQATGGPCRISVHNLPFAVTSENLADIFRPYADATQTKVRVRGNFSLRRRRLRAQHISVVRIGHDACSNYQAMEEQLNLLESSTYVGCCLVVGATLWLTTFMRLR